MQPALSIIFFTVVSGAGFGLFIALSVAGLFGKPSAETATAACITGLVLITSGLVSSTFHLANPKNAWRAFSRFKTSWLAREGVLAVAFYPLALAYAALWWTQSNDLANPLWVLASLLTGIVALATTFSTGMIYACLKTIRQWHTPLTPANYILLSLAPGYLLLLTIEDFAGAGVSAYELEIALGLLAVAALMKLIYYAWMPPVPRAAQGPAQGPTINTATGFTRATVRLLDVGHGAGTFLTEEFGYRLAREKSTLLRWLVFALGFALPALLVVAGLTRALHWSVAFPALLSSVAGIFIERWLFFAEARHVVNLYHGAQRT